MPFKRVAKAGKKKKVRLPAKKKPVTVFEIVMENMSTRRSVRKFLKRDVPMSEIYKVLDAARQAPSNENRQPWEFVIVKEKEMKKILADAAGQSWIKDAPVIIVACGNVRTASIRVGERGSKLYAIQDVAAAIENLLLAANALGLGATWVGGFSEAKITGPLRLPGNVRPAAMIPIGWPSESPKASDRHEVADFAHLEQYGTTPRSEFVWGHGHVEDY